MGNKGTFQKMSNFINALRQPVQFEPLRNNPSYQSASAFQGTHGILSAPLRDTVQFGGIQQKPRSVQFGGRLSRFMELPEVPASERDRKLDEYSEPQPPGENRFMELRRAKDNGWEFVARTNAKGAIHNVVIVQDDDEKQTPYVVLTVTKASVFGGQPKIMLPAGLWGDKDSNETFVDCAWREVREETGLDNIQVMPLAGEARFVTSGGLTTERKGFALCKAEGVPNLNHLDEEGEVGGHYLVPLSTFLNRKQFTKWVAEVTQKGYLVEADIVMAAGLINRSQVQALMKGAADRPDDV